MSTVRKMLISKETFYIRLLAHKRDHLDRVQPQKVESERSSAESILQHKTKTNTSMTTLTQARKMKKPMTKRRMSQKIKRRMKQRRLSHPVDLIQHFEGK